MRLIVTRRPVSPVVLSGFEFRSGSDASPVLRCDPLGGLPCQSFPATGGRCQQLGQSAGGKPGPAEPAAGQSSRLARSQGFVTALFLHGSQSKNTEKCFIQLLLVCTPAWLCIYPVYSPHAPFISACGGTLFWTLRTGEYELVKTNTAPHVLCFEMSFQALPFS